MNCSNTAPIAGMRYNLDLDALLSDDEKTLPTTYEEWVEINGEPVEQSYISIVPKDEVESEINNQTFTEMAQQSVAESKNGKKFIDGIFAKAYMHFNTIVHSNGAFYTPEGMKKVSAIRNEINDSIYDIFPYNIALSTTRVINALKDMSYQDNFTFFNKMIVPFANGDLTIEDNEWVFHHEDKQPVPYRLPVKFVPLTNRRKTPNFDKWLKDLFHKDDVLTLQEFIGYCFLPTTRCQKALFVIGEGGVGKSVLGSILSAIFGSSVTAPDDTMMFLADKFKTAELENQLVFYEDDLTDTLLNDAGKFKKLVTSQTAITADRKNEQPFKFVPYCRFIMCGNHMIKSTKDKSDGFYRRLLPISVKPKDQNRKAIFGFENMVKAEAEGIAQWALDGLKRLIDHNWEFTVSKESETYMRDYRELTDPVQSFVDDCIMFGADYDMTNSELFSTYTGWCNKNATKPWSKKNVKEWFFNNLGKYGMSIDSNGNIKRDDRRERGYKGAKVKEEYLKSHTINFL